MNARIAILKVIEHEGGAAITNIKNDSGGLTKFGISQKAYPNLDIRNLTLEDAVAIYKRDYWDKIKGDLIKNYAVAFSLFDQAVNRGVSTVIKQAQRVLNIKDDGIPGQEFLNKINAVNPENFINSFIEASKEAYRKIASNDGPNDPESIFLKGWLNRLDSVKNYAKANIGKTVLVGSGFFLILIFLTLIFLGSSKKK